MASTVCVLATVFPFCNVFLYCFTITGFDFLKVEEMAPGLTVLVQDRAWGPYWGLQPLGSIYTRLLGLESANWLAIVTLK